jgi:hypothetical protein
MANIVVTQTGNCVVFVYNDESAGQGFIRLALNTIDIAEIEEVDGAIKIEMSDDHEYCFTGDATNTNDDLGIVESVGGVTTDDNTKLFDELIKTIQ